MQIVGKKEKSHSDFHRKWLIWWWEHMDSNQGPSACKA
jgi:hypothetical protein